MISPRVRRLNHDYERLQARFANWPLIQLTGSAGLPPEYYRVAYSIRGLYVDAAGTILDRTEHVLEINLSLGYPRRAPQCRMLTPVFHPNFDDVSVCIGDFWAASERLDDLIVRIGRMIAYQEYNSKSPLNGLAARWAAEHPQFLPIDPREIAPPLLEKSEIDQQVRTKTVAPEPSAETAPADPWSDKIVIP
jgi:ubiquitin-protein ligase